MANCMSISFRMTTDITSAGVGFGGGLRALRKQAREFWLFETPRSVRAIGNVGPDAGIGMREQGGDRRRATGGGQWMPALPDRLMDDGNGDSRSAVPRGPSRRCVVLH